MRAAAAYQDVVKLISMRRATEYTGRYRQNWLWFTAGADRGGSRAALESPERRPESGFASHKRSRNSESG